MAYPGRAEGDGVGTERERVAGFRHLEDGFHQAWSRAYRRGGDGLAGFSGIGARP
jgi:hypothetical protein